jgi:hypothetical protein
MMNPSIGNRRSPGEADNTQNSDLRDCGLLGVVIPSHDCIFVHLYLNL